MVLFFSVFLDSPEYITSKHQTKQMQFAYFAGNKWWKSLYKYDSHSDNCYTIQSKKRSCSVKIN